MAAFAPPDFIRHSYKVSKELKTYTVYQIDVFESSYNLLTETIRIEPFYGKSDTSKIKDYLRLRTTKNWTTSELVTGLRATAKSSVFYGDRKHINGKKSLLIFSFSEDRQTLFLDVYRSFYPKHNGILQSIIKTY